MRIRGLLVALLTIPSPGTAQDAVYLAPPKYTAAVGERMNLSLRRPGQPDAIVDWKDDDVAWALVRVAGTQENSDRAPRADEASPPGTVRITTAGAAVIGVDLRPRVVQLDAPTMQSLVEQTGRRPDPPQAAPAPVLLFQSLKTIIRVGQPEPGQSPNVTAKTGQQVELRPTFDPTGIGIGSDIPVVVYAGEGKVPRAKLIATHIATGEKQEVTANASAIGSFRLSRPGAWRVEFRHLAQPKERKEGDPAWVLYTATLTFEARGTRPEGEVAK